MRNSTVFNCNIIELNKFPNRAGNITVVEGNRSMPFDINRVYYLYDVPAEEERGGHAHKELYQIMIAASGSFNINLDDGKTKRSFFLNHPNQALLIIPGIWRELNDFSSGSVCLVLASLLYDAKDYIRDYSEFLNYKK
jgi:hypothetical protein